MKFAEKKIHRYIQAYMDIYFFSKNSYNFKTEMKSKS